MVVVRSRFQRLNYSFANDLSRLILLTTLAFPTIEAILAVACVLGADEFKEFIAFEGRGVTS